MTGELLIKVCGLTSEDNLRRVEALPEVDFTGFVRYAPSPRYAASPPPSSTGRPLRVGVYVDEGMDAILRDAERYGLGCAQLHGGEPPSLCQALRLRGLKVIKALPVATEDDLAYTLLYRDSCDYLLFDTKCAGHGGSGRQFRWDILRRYEGPTPFLLSGGIGPDDAEALAAFRHPLLAGVDLNSRFETRPGEKDTELLRAFLRTLTHLVINPKKQ